MEGSIYSKHVRSIPQMLIIPVSMGVAAGIYMFTTDSPFNQIQFSDYVLLGTPIVPFLDQLGSVRNDSSGVGFINGSAGMV